MSNYEESRVIIAAAAHFRNVHCKDPESKEKEKMLFEYIQKVLSKTGYNRSFQEIQLKYLQCLKQLAPKVPPGHHGESTSSNKEQVSESNGTSAVHSADSSPASNKRENSHILNGMSPSNSVDIPRTDTVIQNTSDTTLDGNKNGRKDNVLPKTINIESHNESSSETSSDIKCEKDSVEKDRLSSPTITCISNDIQSEIGFTLILLTDDDFVQNDILSRTSLVTKKETLRLSVNKKTAALLAASTPNDVTVDDFNFISLEKSLVAKKTSRTPSLSKSTPIVGTDDDSNDILSETSLVARGKPRTPLKGKTKSLLSVCTLNDVTVDPNNISLETPLVAKKTSRTPLLSKYTPNVVTDEDYNDILSETSHVAKEKTQKAPLKKKPKALLSGSSPNVVTFDNSTDISTDTSVVAKKKTKFASLKRKRAALVLGSTPNVVTVDNPSDIQSETSIVAKQKTQTPSLKRKRAVLLSGSTQNVVTIDNSTDTSTETSVIAKKKTQMDSLKRKRTDLVLESTLNALTVDNSTNIPSETSIVPKQKTQTPSLKRKMAVLLSESTQNVVTIDNSTDFSMDTSVVAKKKTQRTPSLKRKKAALLSETTPNVVTFVNSTDISTITSVVPKKKTKTPPVKRKREALLLGSNPNVVTMGNSTNISTETSVVAKKKARTSLLLKSAPIDNTTNSSPETSVLDFRNERTFIDISTQRKVDNHDDVTLLQTTLAVTNEKDYDQTCVSTTPTRVDGPCEKPPKSSLDTNNFRSTLVEEYLLSPSLNTEEMEGNIGVKQIPKRLDNLVGNSLQPPSIAKKKVVKKNLKHIPIIDKNSNETQLQPSEFEKIYEKKIAKPITINECTEASSEQSLVNKRTRVKKVVKLSTVDNSIETPKEPSLAGKNKKGKAVVKPRVVDNSADNPSQPSLANKKKKVFNTKRMLTIIKNVNGNPTQASEVPKKAKANKSLTKVVSIYNDKLSGTDMLSGNSLNIFAASAQAAKAEKQTTIACRSHPIVKRKKNVTFDLRSFLKIQKELLRNKVLLTRMNKNIKIINKKLNLVLEHL